MPNKQKLTPEEKENIVRPCLSGELGIREASRMAGVDNISVRRWIARY